MQSVVFVGWFWFIFSEGILSWLLFSLVIQRKRWASFQLTFHDIIHSLFIRNLNFPFLCLRFMSALFIIFKRADIFLSETIFDIRKSFMKLFQFETIELRPRDILILMLFFFLIKFKRNSLSWSLIDKRSLTFYWSKWYNYGSL